MKYTPYAYLIGWSKMNIWYYGIEYGIKTKTAHPKNLWCTYFTSSRQVSFMRDFYGEPDVIQIRKTFSTQTQALLWEQKVLHRINAVSSKRWLNENVGGSIKWATNAGNRKPRTQKQKESARQSLTLTRKLVNPFSGKRHSKKSIQKMKDAMKITTCPHCAKTGMGNSMKRWHFDKCKSA